MKITEAEKHIAANIISNALREDIGSGDVTTDSIVPELALSTAKIIAKDKGTIAGLEIAEMVFRYLDSAIAWQPNFEDGQQINNDDVIVEFTGSHRAILSGERVALNFLQRLSGIAAASAKFVEAVRGLDVKILDTRKTVPGLRMLDKYAVRAGGAKNHRIGLYDMAMIKDNHIEIAGSITNAVQQVRQKIKPGIKIEVETKDIEEVEEALNAGADIIMLDNMTIGQMKKSVELINGKALIEASGSVNLENVRNIAKTGVNFISVGALTHSVKALDIGQYIINNAL